MLPAAEGTIAISETERGGFYREGPSAKRLRENPVCLANQAVSHCKNARAGDQKAVLQTEDGSAQRILLVGAGHPQQKSLNILRESAFAPLRVLRGEGCFVSRRSTNLTRICRDRYRKRPPASMPIPIAPRT